MRLLDTTTFELTEFFGTNIPLYAILSHRWEESEVTIQDLQLESRIEMKAWSKIVGACTQAKNDGWKYMWIDSCCIDKSSSAELSEAINSMFQWYTDAQMCYAYLSDVPSGQSKGSHSAKNSRFRNSIWFTRGWTLQELLAPDIVVFFDCGWKEIGTKSSLSSVIQSITGINFLFNYNQACIAQKMSWASSRKTLREEDMAYCLLGLFGVHMPLLYGEGKNAFARLQLEILKVSQDESIFAWATTRSDFAWAASDSQRGLFAQSPADFQHQGDVILGGRSRPSPYMMTNKGLQMDVYLCQAEMTIGPDERVNDLKVKAYYDIPLYCFKGNLNTQLAIRVAMVEEEDERLFRSNYDKHHLWKRDPNETYVARTIFISQPELEPHKRQPKTLLIDTKWAQENGMKVVGFSCWHHSYRGNCDCSRTNLTSQDGLFLPLLSVQYLIILETASMRFGLGIGSYSVNVPRICFHTYDIDKKVADIERNYRQYGIGVSRQDITTLELNFGRVLSASLRKGIVGEELCFVVNLAFE